MKKINSIWAILLFAIVPMLFTSCEQQQDASDAILGTWKLEKQSYRTYYDGVLEDSGASYEDEDWQTFLTFSSGNQMTYEQRYYSEDYFATEVFHYEIDGNRIYTNFTEEMFNDEIQYFRIKRLTSDELVLLVEYVGLEEGCEYKVQYLWTYRK